MSLISSNKTETNVYALEIAISAENFNAAVQKAYLKRRKSVSVPGFRKGKAPRPIIERLYGGDFFYEDALDLVFPETVKAAYDEAGLTPVDSPRDLDVKTMSAEEGVVMTFNVVVKPEITLRAYKGLVAEKTEPRVAREEVEEEIKRAIERSARLIDVDDRPAQVGDIVYVDFEGFIDGVPFKGGKAENRPLTLGSNAFVPGFEDGITGRRAGEEFDVAVTLPADYAPELASREAVFKVRLREIKIKELPELDDEFAKDMGEYETVEEFRTGIEKELLERKTAVSDRNFENAVMEALRDAAEGEIPECMYESRIRANADAFEQELAERGIDLEAYLSYTGMDKEAFENQTRERAKAEVRTELAIEKVAELEKIEASDEEIAEEYEKTAQAYGTDAEELGKIISRETVADEIVRRKAIRLVIDSAEPKKPSGEKTSKKKSASSVADKNKADAKNEKKPAAKKTAKTEKKKETAE